MHTSARSIRHASPLLLPRNQRRHVQHLSNYTHQQVYNADELVFGLGVALLFSLWPVGSVHFIVSGLLPLSTEASIELLLQLRHLRIFLNYDICTRFCERVVVLLLVT